MNGTNEKVFAQCVHGSFVIQDLRNRSMVNQTVRSVIAPRPMAIKVRTTMCIALLQLLLKLMKTLANNT